MGRKAWGEALGGWQLKASPWTLEKEPGFPHCAVRWGWQQVSQPGGLWGAWALAKQVLPQWRLPQSESVHGRPFSMLPMGPKDLTCAHLEEAEWGAKVASCGPCPGEFRTHALSQAQSSGRPALSFVRVGTRYGSGPLPLSFPIWEV